jgi:hypothetical protein
MGKEGLTFLFHGTSRKSLFQLLRFPGFLLPLPEWFTCQVTGWLVQCPGVGISAPQISKGWASRHAQNSSAQAREEETKTGSEHGLLVQKRKTGNHELSKQGPGQTDPANQLY